MTTDAPAAVAATEIPLDRLAKMYIKMRDKLQELTRAYDIATEEIKAQQDIVSAAMKDQIRAMGDNIKSVKTEHGTIMLTTKTRYYADDWDAFGAFVVSTGDVSLMEKRIAQTNMAEYLSAHPEAAPPGLNSISEIAVSVRKPSAK